MIFLRHPTPDIPPGICYGRTDMDIAPIGHEQINTALKKTPKLTQIFASPAKRCRKLAMSFGNRDGLTINFDPRLWEMDMGIWEGIPWADMDRNLSDHWLEDPVNRRTPQGESFADLQKRVADFLSEIPIDHHASTAIICHAGPIRATQMAWQGITFKQAFKQTPEYASPIEIWHPKRN